MRGFIALAAIAAAALAAPPALAQRDQRRAEITPYIAIDQVVSASLKTDDSVTYTDVSAGVDAQVLTRRIAIGASVNYEHRFSYQRRYGDDDVVNGLVRGVAKVAPGLQIEGGALATRARGDTRGIDPGFFTGNRGNTSKLYSVFAGPSYATNFGPLGASANYRIGYTKVTVPGFTGVPAGQPRTDYFDDELSQEASASLSVKSGVLFPFGATLSGAWERDDAGQLDQRFDGKYVRGDVIQPVSGTFAVTAGAGYEKIEISQRDPQRDVQGNPVIDANGRYATDPASPRRLAYNTDGLFWDAGVVWKPSPRTSLEARVGRRYGSMSYTGTLSYAPRPDTALAVGVYDQVTTFGHQLRGALNGLPTSFVASRDQFVRGFNGCAFGTNGSAGGCLNGVLQSVSSAAYRARGVDAVLSTSRGRYTAGIGAGYAQRRFFAPESVGFTVSGVTDESWYGQAFAGVELTPRSSANLNAFVNYYQSGLPGAGSVLGSGATGTYNVNFGRLGASASLGLYGFDQDKGTSDLTASALLGMRYSF